MPALSRCDVWGKGKEVSGTGCDSPPLSLKGTRSSPEGQAPEARGSRKWPELCIAQDSFRETMCRGKPEFPCEELRFGWCATRRNLEEGDVGLCYPYLPALGPPKRASAWGILGPTGGPQRGKITHLRYALWPASALYSA